MSEDIPQSISGEAAEAAEAAYASARPDDREAGNKDIADEITLILPFETPPSPPSSPSPLSPPQAASASPLARSDQDRMTWEQIKKLIKMEPLTPSGPIPLGETNPRLFRRTDRLTRFRRWLNEDPELAAIFDGVLKEQIKAATRRQVIISVVVSILCLIAGWLLNAINPVSLGVLFHH